MHVANAVITERMLRSNARIDYIDLDLSGSACDCLFLLRPCLVHVIDILKILVYFIVTAVSLYKYLGLYLFLTFTYMQYVWSVIYIKKQ